MLAGEHIQFPSERVGWGGGGLELLGGNIPLAHTTCHFIRRLLFFFFWCRNRTHTLAAIRKSCQLAIFTQLGWLEQRACEKGLKSNTHTWYWRKRWWSGVSLPWPGFVRRTQSCLRPAADPRQWTWGCRPPGGAARCFPAAGRCEASCNWCRLDRWPRSVTWRCGRAEHPGIWAPWWTGWRQSERTKLEKEESKRIRAGLLLTFYCFFQSLSGGMWCLD